MVCRQAPFSLYRLQLFERDKPKNLSGSTSKTLFSGYSFAIGFVHHATLRARTYEPGTPRPRYYYTRIIVFVIATVTLSVSVPCVRQVGPEARTAKCVSGSRTLAARTIPRRLRVSAWSGHVSTIPRFERNASTLRPPLYFMGPAPVPRPQGTICVRRVRAGVCIEKRERRREGEEKREG